MQFQYTNLETCHEATGLVVVIDVICAFVITGQLSDGSGDEECDR